MPRVKCPGMPARRNASTRCERYWAGTRSSTAMRSKRVPARACSTMRRAISTHSRLSPGAENTAMLASSAGWSGVPANRLRCARRSAVSASAASHACGSTASAAPSAAMVLPSPRAAVHQMPAARLPSAATSSRSSGARMATLTITQGAPLTSAAPSSTARTAAASTPARSARPRRPSSASYSARMRARSGEVPSSASDETRHMRSSARVRAMAGASPGLSARPW